MDVLSKTTVQMVAEAGALVFVAPWLFRMAADEKLSEADRTWARRYAWATIVIDGGLLLWHLTRGADAPR